MNTLPQDFLVGAATAAHQVEGNNIHSDYWAMEHMKYGNFNEPSLDAVDHYNRYEEDIKMVAEAGLNAYRFSIEWARIEPEQGVYDENEIEHYRKVLTCCRENGVEPIVTMMHFTSPKWLIENGGWENEATVEAFKNYCQYVTEQLGDLMHYVCTINEANMGIQVAAISARYRAQMMAKMQQMQQGGAEEKKDLEGTAQVGMNFNDMMANMQKQKEENVEIFGTDTLQTFVSARTPEGDMLVIRAHQAAKAAMKAVKPELQIGLTLSLHDIQAQEGGEETAAKEWVDEFTHYVPYIKEDDFFGLQNYSRSLIGPNGILPVPEGAEITQMDYEYYPEGLEHVIRRVYEEMPMPIMVTENGIATADDTRRVAYIQTAMKGVENCIQDGIPVKGYMYWSMMDNFEWQKGFGMTFGLISVDRTTQTRTAKPSLAVLGNYTK
ncbi:glycoside hydrolase family 1 protein [Roseburia intestinalis]|uniref:glycoside hydrolase family 1 protein n=1 Tax=Roseburia intestinalis TaxID=166486 RepID=UPI00156FE466|nr:family 1 glycosylhydrolase [Roseburia intestinalis]NSC35253.1 glycoside hydrolase family 1 protein [Roseburia intestinalis]